jgi:hypothetical protein
MTLSLLRLGPQGRQHGRIAARPVGFQPIAAQHVHQRKPEERQLLAAGPWFPPGGLHHPWIAQPNGGELYFSSLRLISDASINLAARRFSPSNAAQGTVTLSGWSDDGH